MLIAKLTSKGIVAATVLGLSLGAAAVGVVSHVLLEADPEPFAFAHRHARLRVVVPLVQHKGIPPPGI